MESDTTAKVLKIILNIFLWPLFLLIYTIPLILLFAIRLSIDYFVIRQNPSLSVLSPNDILLVREAPAVQRNVGGGFILKIEGDLSIEDFKNGFWRKFLQPAESTKAYESLYCDIVKKCGFLFKRRLRDSTSLEFWDSHFISMEFGDEADIKKELSSWFQSPFDEGAPLWQALILREGAKAKTWIAFRAHHGLMDGYSFVHIMDKLCDKSEVGPELGSNLGVGEELVLLFSLPFVAISYLFRYFYSPDPFTGLFPLLKEVPLLPMSLFSVFLSPLKRIRRHLGVHFPSLVYSLQIGALARAIESNPGFPKLPGIWG